MIAAPPLRFASPIDELPMNDGREPIAPSWWRVLRWRPWSLELEPVSPAHSARVARALSEDIAAWLGIGGLDEMRAGTPVWAAESHELALRGDTYRYLVVQDGVLAGVIELRRDAVNGHIGYWLRTESRGKGTITRANRLILLIAFEGLGLKAVDWTAADGNDDSIAVMTRLGAEYMDTYPTPGRLYRDSEVRYRLTRRSHHVADSGPRNLRELLTCD